MTPFGIRKRLKKMLGGAPDKKEKMPPRPEPAKFTITLVDPEGSEETSKASVESTLLFATGNMAKPLGSGCADATCGTCRVDVLEGAEHLPEQSARERATLKENGFSTDMRLGCQVEVKKPGANIKIRGYEFVI
jgi:ferredoxin